MPALTAVDVAEAPGGWVLTLTEGDTVTGVRCGDGTWPDVDDSAFVASGGWTGDGVFEASVVAVETPHVLHLRCAGDTVEARWNGLPLNRPVLATLRAPGR